MKPHPKSFKKSSEIKNIKLGGVMEETKKVKKKIEEIKSMG
jgi:hypothetical protein